MYDSRGTQHHQQQQLSTLPCSNFRAQPFSHLDCSALGLPCHHLCLARCCLCCCLHIIYQLPPGIVQVTPVHNEAYTHPQQILHVTTITSTTPQERMQANMYKDVRVAPQHSSAQLRQGSTRCARAVVFPLTYLYACRALTCSRSSIQRHSASGRRLSARGPGLKGMTAAGPRRASGGLQHT